MNKSLRDVRARRLEVAERWVEKYAKRISVSKDVVRLPTEILQSYYNC